MTMIDAVIGPNGTTITRVGGGTNALAYSWYDPERAEDGWESPEDWHYRWSYAEACAQAMASGLAARHDTATLTVTAYVRPCQLGCMEEDGTPITPGECGEPAESRFVVTVTRVDGFRESWHVV